MGNKYRVLVVDDASFMTKAISETLESDSEVEVIGTAKNGLEGLEKIKELRPDVITLDIDMPVMNGIEAIRHIMIECQVPVVVLSSLFNDGSVTFEALRLGVVDFVAKPSGAISRDIHTAKKRLLDRIKLATSVNLENVRRVRVSKNDRLDGLSDRHGFQPLEYLITMGTSLSGPNTFIRLMTALSPSLPAAAVIVLEISPQVLPAFVEKFNNFVSWKIAVAEEDQVLEQGVCYIHSNESSLTVQTNSEGESCFKLADSVEKPLDLLFTSAAEVFKQQTVGLLLTGYGDDGASGFARIQEKSGVTIAQSVETCVYPNLTDNAIKKRTVDHIVEENKLAETIESIIS
ncbi:MAG: chemotaxis protein CheB [Thermodesulfobacteriota bacterium]